MKNSLVTILVLLVSFFLGQWLVELLIEWNLGGEQILYSAESRETHSRANSINWHALLPDDEADIIGQYQQQGCASSDCDSIDQITQALNAAHDKQYIAALTSSRLSEKHMGKRISIPGFIVPLDISEKQTIVRFFLVPYFGACLHYPPPAPNQMIMVRSPSEIKLPDIFTPYRVEGIITAGMYEDPLGTSAYLLDLEHLETYVGEPDDVRSHQ